MSTTVNETLPASAYSLGEFVKLTGKTDGGTDLKGQKGQIMVAFFSGYSTSYNFKIKVIEGDKRGNSYEMHADNIGKLRTQTLIAYQDKNDEVHWSTRAYTPSQAKRLGYKRAPESFDKKIDLE